MQKSDNSQVAQTTHHRVQTSTTLNRKYVKRPSKITDIAVRRAKPQAQTQVQAQAQEQMQTQMQAQEQAQEQAQATAPAQTHPIQKVANSKMRSRNAQKATKISSAMTAKELKDQAIRKALAAASASDSADNIKVAKKSRKGNKIHFGFGKVMLALTCAAAAVFAIVYFVNLNMPDISLRVAAMQTGIDATYPSYVPRDYSVSSITSEEGMVTLNFVNSTTGESFSLIEEKSYWDSSALLSNYVKEEYNENYTVVREQGITLYISGSNAAWVNGGIVYKIITNSGTLTNKQIRSIAVSL